MTPARRERVSRAMLTSLNYWRPVYGEECGKMAAAPLTAQEVALIAELHGMHTTRWAD